MDMNLNTILEAGNWSEPKEINTKFGPKFLRSCEPSEALSKLYKTSKEEMKKLGFSYSKNVNTEEWICNLWLEIPKEIVEKRNEEIKKSIQTTTDFIAPSPSGLSFYPFQNAGIEYMKDRKNILLADEMGLGKTIQAIGFINLKKEINKVIIVCPKSLVLNWENELKKWLNKSLTIKIINDISNYKNENIIIINYEKLSKIQSILAEENFDLCILDEAHKIKNEKTIRSKNCKMITSEYKIRITGTPIMNKPKDLYNLISDLSPEFNNYWKFVKRYCDYKVNEYGYGVYDGCTNASELQELLRRTIMVRRLKSEVLTELPQKIRQIVEIEPSKNIDYELEYMEKSIKNKEKLINELNYSKLMDNEEEYLKAVEKLKEFNIHNIAEMARLRHKTALMKVDSVCELIREELEDNNEKKVVIAAHHTDVIEKLLFELKEFNPVSITGNTDITQRQYNVDEFQNNKECRIFIGSITAAGVGITLTSSDWMVFVELDWTPANMNQMEDRIHRIGQESQVLIQHIVIENSIDSMMVKKLIDKQKMIDKALNNYQSPEYDEYDGNTITPEENDSVVKEFSFKKLQNLINEIIYTEEQKEEILKKLKIIASKDNDFAQEKNGIGFNKFDSYIGHSLAQCDKLSNKQAIIADKLIKKYIKQL